MKGIYRVLMFKDMKEVVRNKQVFLPMIVVPLIILVLLPALFVAISFFGAESPELLQDMSSLIARLPDAYKGYNPGQLFMVVAINYIFPAFFLIVPVMISSILGASSFVGEREKKTMESLLYTPITMEELLKAKILGTFIPSYLASLLAFVLFGAAVNVGGYLHFGRLIFPDVKWVIIALWLTPIVTLFSITFTVLVSAKSKTFQGAMQISGLMVLPVVLLIVGQFAGLFLLDAMIVVAIGAVMLFINYFLIKLLAKTFMAEKLV